MTDRSYPVDSPESREEPYLESDDKIDRAEQQKWDDYYSSAPVQQADEATQAFCEEFVEQISLLFPDGASILEAGCGGGWQSLALARHERFQVTLMDFSREALKYARRLFDVEELSARFMYGDVFHNGKPEFDLVFNAGVLEHYTLERQAAFLKGMASRSRNYVLVLVPNRLCYWYWIWRTREVVRGNWPYGKEVPLVDLSDAFRAAGLRFIGQRFMGTAWTEVFINNIAGIDESLRSQILEVHRSAMIPDQHNAYLLAALGTVASDTDKKEVKINWAQSTMSEKFESAEVYATLGDALALRISGEVKLNQMESRLKEIESHTQTLAGEVSAREDEAKSLSSSLAERDKALAESSLQLDALKRALESRSLELERKQSTIQMLSSTVDEVTSKLAEASQTAESLAGKLAAVENELQKTTATLGWRILNKYGRIKYRYLLPIYRVLRLPPYGKSAEEGRSRSGFDTDEVAFVAGWTTAFSSQTGASHSPNAYDVICLPIIEWEFRFQRPQQLMLRFAEAGHRVFYISQHFRSTGPRFIIEEKSENIFEVSLRGLDRTVYTDPLDDEACFALYSSLNELRRELQLGATVSFVQLPFWWPLADRARASFAWPIVYDCMDYHAGFSTNRQEMLDHESDLLSSADLVVVSSAYLQGHANPANSNVLLIRNACDYERFASARAVRGERPVVGYYGAIADWFDSDLVADLAERRPDWDFWLVGSTFSSDTSRLSELSNVSLLGEKPYSEIADWLARFDVVIIPFKRLPLTEATNPVKAYEILAAGKPLVSVGIPEVADLAPLARIASTVDDFEREIEAALAEDEPGLVDKRRAFAREHTWAKRYETLAPGVDSVFPKASIIVVTFNNLHLNRLCLESIYSYTEWPNFEVIVVDNDSTDGTPEYLKEAQASFPNLRAILNDSNMGFAAANNIGLREATGDYLILLNNDTVVTRGWLSALIRHLHSHHQIGLIGPVTNAISNQAKVEVGYERLEELSAWAAEYVRRNDGQIFPIPMLAMFCVAMRRAVFERVGYLDERFGVGMFEDDDYCRRLRSLGYELRCARDSFVHHWQLASFRLIGADEYLRVYNENKQEYDRKWGGASEDPANKPQARTEYVSDRISKSKGAIVFLPSIGWNINLFQRPHHLAREFARQGYVSIFDSSNSQDEVRGFKEIEPNLFLYRGPEEVLHELPDLVLWTFAYNFDRKDFFPAGTRTVYDCIDDLEVFPYDSSLLKRNHHRGLTEATIVVCVARKLHREAVEVRGDAIYLPNGVEFERFSSEAPVPEDSSLQSFLSEGKPIAGYYGAFANWFDYDLLTQVALMRPDWNFLLIGQMLDKSLAQGSLLALRNVKWIGPRDYRSLPGFLSSFDVAMIPFLINNITASTSPLKLYEYMAGGKPVVTTPMPECMAFPEVLIAGDVEAFSKALDTARERGGDPGFRASLRAIARENSWNKRVRDVGNALGSHAEKTDSREQGRGGLSHTPGEEEL